jgi:hypothetical protein
MQLMEVTHGWFDWLGFVMTALGLVLSFALAPDLRLWAYRKIGAMNFRKVAWSLPILLVMIIVSPVASALLEPRADIPLRAALYVGTYPEAAFHSVILQIAANLGMVAMVVLFADVWSGGTISAILFYNVNVLAWVGWEVLEVRRPNSLRFLRTRFKITYYNRGIGVDTEIYDGSRTLFQVILLDAERLAASEGNKSANLTILPDNLVSYRAQIAEFVRNLLTNLQGNSLEYGIPVRFGYNEILYSRNFSKLFLPPQGIQTVSYLKLSNLQAKRQEYNLGIRGPFTVVLWDWYLPTMATLLAIYATPAMYAKAREDLAQSVADQATAFKKPTGIVKQEGDLATVFWFDEPTVKAICEDIRKEFQAFHGRFVIRRDVKEIHDHLLELKKRPDGESGLTLVLGCGSIAIPPGFDKMEAFYAREGILTWIEFASLLMDYRARGSAGTGKNGNLAAEAIEKLLLSPATQRKLLSLKSQPPYGQPTIADALDDAMKSLTHQAARVSQRVLESQAPLSRYEVPLVLRRLPKIVNGIPMNDVWEREWAILASIARDKQQ